MIGLGLPQNYIDNPATKDVRPRLAAMAEDVGAVAAGRLKGISQLGHAVEGLSS
jgi:hypothetical protein